MSLTMLVVTAEAVVLAFGILTFLTLIGLGPVALLLPKADGLGFLVAPAAGLAVLAISFQWLSILVPPWVVAVIDLVALGPLGLVAFWRNRAALQVQTYDLAGAALCTVGLYVSLLQIDIQRGFLTLGGLASDNVFIYVQAAQYLRDHPIPSALHALAPQNPGSLYFVSSGVTSFPNSVGQLDAATSVLTGLPVYAVFDPLNALSVALTIGPLWFLVRAGMGASVWTGLAAAAVLATNQLMYWLVGSGFQQEAEALPIFLAALAVAVHAWRIESAKAGALAGIIAGSLLGLYLPIAVLFLFCALTCLVVHFTVGSRLHRTRLLQPLAGAVVCGVVAAGPAIYILLFRGGLATWVSTTGSRYAAGNISTFPPFPYLFGTLPFAHVWEQSLWPLTQLDIIVFPALIAASAGLVALLLIGHVRSAILGHAAAAALLTGGMLFVGYEVGVARYPYGYVKSVTFLVPLMSVFVASGAIGLEWMARSSARPKFQTALKAAGITALCLVVLASAVTSRDMLKMWVGGEPTFPRSYLSLSNLTSAVPVGASVFVDDQTDDYRTLVKVAAIAYFLADREVRVYTGNTRLGTFPEQDVRPSPCHFDYVIRSGAPEGDFQTVYVDPAAGLNVYKRSGPACG